MSEFFQFGIDFGSPNGGQNGEKIDTKQDRKKDAFKNDSGGRGRWQSAGPVGGFGGVKKGYTCTHCTFLKEGTHGTTLVHAKVHAKVQAQVYTRVVQRENAKMFHTPGPPQGVRRICRLRQLPPTPAAWNRVEGG